MLSLIFTAKTFKYFLFVFLFGECAHISGKGGVFIKTLKFGSRGPSVQLLQTALNRYGLDYLDTDGIFGQRTRSAVLAFQSAKGLSPNGIADRYTHRALLPWYTGFLVHTIKPGDSFYLLSRRYSSSISAIQTANPTADAHNLQIGSKLIIPLSFPVVPTDIACSSQLLAFCVQGLSARYPFLERGEIGKSVMGKPLWSLKLGRGPNRVMYNAGHHANEWLNCILILKFAEKLCDAYANNLEIEGIDTSELMEYAEIMLVPALNPDGIDLATGALDSGEFFTAAQRIADNYPQIPFPSGWKANIRGTDLNLQYPAEWERAKEIRFAQGYTSPAPTYYVGRAPLSAPESRALYRATLNFDPALTLSYHSQGRVIFWKYLDYEPENSRKIGELFSSLSGYALEETPSESAFAGYKDWFIQDFDRPGYTIETGLGTNPLPIEQFNTIYDENIGILLSAAIVS